MRFRRPSWQPYCSVVRFSLRPAITVASRGEIKTYPSTLNNIRCVRPSIDRLRVVFYSRQQWSLASEKLVSAAILSARTDRTLDLSGTILSSTAQCSPDRTCSSSAAWIQIAPPPARWFAGPASRRILKINENIRRSIIRAHKQKSLIPAESGFTRKIFVGGRGWAVYMVRI